MSFTLFQAHAGAPRRHTSKAWHSILRGALSCASAAEVKRGRQVAGEGLGTKTDSLTRERPEELGYI